MNAIQIYTVLAMQLVICYVLVMMINGGMIQTQPHIVVIKFNKKFAHLFTNNDVYFKKQNQAIKNIV